MKSRGPEYRGLRLFPDRGSGTSKLPFFFYA
nr:MAG TPA: hypothetical protein [Herelleviridae sp.]